MPAPGSLNPATLQPLEPVAYATTEGVRDAIAAARAAQPAWAARPQSERNDIVRAIAIDVVARRAEVAAIMADETGRSASESILSEIVALLPGIEGHIKTATDAAEPQFIGLSMIDHPGKKCRVIAQPRGVIGIIAPWNYPLMNFFKSLWPALLCGNAVVMKPSEHTPRTGAWLHSVATKYLPEGLLQCVQGGGDIGAALLEHKVDGLVFTGSLRTGRRVAARAGELLIPCSLELGGKDPAIVLADCDPVRTAAGIAHWGMHNAGQDCAAIERVYVEDSIADAFVDRLTAVVAQYRVAPGDAQTEIGPLQNEAQLAIVADHVNDAVAHGAVLRCGGAPTGRGYGFSPTVLDKCTNDMKVVREETFGPVLAIVRVPDADTAVQLANDNDYGLGASVWTKDIAKGEALAARLEVGMTWVNNHAITSTFTEAPWTGTKGSGPGIAQGIHAYHTFLRRKVVMTDKNSDPDAWWFPANADLDKFADAVAERTLGKWTALFTLLPLLGKRVKAIKALASK